MRRDDPSRLRHMLDAARLAISFTNGRSRSDLDRDPQMMLAMVKAIEIVGEAAGRVSIEYRDSHPEVPWLDVISMRNRLVHAYFDVDLDVLWATATMDLPPLVALLERLLFPPDRP